MKLIASFGVTTSRYKNTIPVSNNKTQIDTPIGPCIVRWDIEKKTRLNFFQAHHHIVTFMQRSPSNPNVIATTSYGGEIKIWNEKWESISNCLQLEDGTLTSAEWSLDGTKFIACTEEKGNLTLIHVKNLNNGKFHLEIISQKKGNFPLASFNVNHEIFCIEQRYNSKENGSNAILFDQNFNEIKKINLEKNDVISILASNSNRKNMGLGYLNDSRKIKIINSESLEVESEFKPLGSGGYKSLLIEDDLLYLPSDNGLFQIYNIKGEKLKEYKIPSGSIYNIEWASQNDNLMWLVNEESLYQVSLQSEQAKVISSVSLHSVTCCGVDFSYDSKFLVSGDFLGNVFLWDIKNHNSVKDINVMASVRCLCWRKNSDWVQIGCMDGSVFNWNIKTDQLQRVITLTSEVICMKWENGELPGKLALGCRDGKLAILHQDLGDDFMKTSLLFIAHPPIKDGEQDGQFGSIGKYSEIWSLKWSPKNDFIATCSEDQTTKIWNSDGFLIKELKGHSTAVTSVDWGLSPIGEVLITCADDKKVMVWNAPDEETDWKLHHEFESRDVHGWFTLTYIALEKLGGRIATVTQNGHLLIWCLSSKKLLFQAKTHTGSIEGLSWNSESNLIGTVSSDCTVNVYNPTILYEK
jgi:WD40 repeat protein